MTPPENEPIKPFSPEDAAKAMQLVGTVVGAYMAKVQKFLNDNPGFLPGLFDYIVNFKSLPQRQKEIWEVAAHQGWYLSGHTIITVDKAVADAPEALAARMKAQLDASWAGITADMLRVFPDRAEILGVAFELHREGRYIASIPLFLAQADGICSEYLGAHLFTETTQREQKLLEIQQSREGFVPLLMSLLGLRTQLNAGMRNSRPDQKLKAPNRHGIMHGSHRHLDYGTEINSLKAFSLLAFLMFLFEGAALSRQRLTEQGGQNASAESGPVSKP